MDSQTPHHARPHPHLYTALPPAAQLQQRTANSTPISSPGLFSPLNMRPSMSFGSQPVSEGATPLGATPSPFLHPLQTHKVRETHTANVDRDFTTGRKLINQYEVIEEIGRGQHGKVKRARNLETGESVAIKIIPRLSKSRRLGRVSAVDPQQNTKREIAILKKIRHPNIVALLEVIDDPELRKIYMVLEHVELGEIVWRKKGLPHICAWERRRVEREMRGEQLSQEEEEYGRLLEHRLMIKELKRAKAKSKSASNIDYWSLEYGATDDEELDPRPYQLGQDLSIRSRPSAQQIARSRDNSRAPSRSVSGKSLSRAGTSESSDLDLASLHDEDDLETPSALRSNPGSMSALGEASVPGSLEDPAFRARSPSMADSIISHMSSVDYNAQAHDPFADDFSYVPCFTMEQARTTFRDTVLGLEYLHYEGVVHRDIKPANLLWTKDYRVKISDFGVSYFGRPIREGEPDDTVSESEARDFDDDRELSRTVGTPAFFAPELCYTDLEREPPKVSEQIDVWSLGVTLYCLIFARIPFMAEDEFSMFKKIATEDVYIPTRRLKPVEPITVPTQTSLYQRVNREPYRDDDDLVYEEIDDLLIDLLKRMLTKNPEKRIRLREVKRHPWVVQGIDNLIAWIDDTDPSRRTAGRKIQVDDREIGRAVVPLTFLERARSVVKKAVGKVMHSRSERAESASRRRATSSAASSAEGSPSNVPGTPYNRDTRRKSLRGDDYFATITQLPTEHPLAQSVTASPRDSPREEGVGLSQSQPGSFGDLAAKHMASPPEARAREESSSWHQPGFQRPLTRHVHARSITNAFLALTPPLQESATVPPTPLGGLEEDDPIASLRTTRDARAAADDASRSRSMDRAGLVFANADKRAEAKVGLSSTHAPGNLLWSKQPRPARSTDLSKEFNAGTGLYLSRAKTVSQHAQQKSESNIQIRRRAETVLEERPSTAHRIQDIPDGKTPPPRVYNSSNSDSFARAQEQLFRRQRQEHEDKTRRRQAAELGKNKDPAGIPCPPSPDDEHPPMQRVCSSREDIAATGGVSSKSTSFGAIATPLTSPSDIMSPIGSHTSNTARDVKDSMLAFQSDPSLPALLSGASSVSADVEGEFLGNPGVVNNGPSLVDTTESLTPPALNKEPLAGFPLEHQELRDPQEGESGAIPVHLDAGASKAARTSPLARATKLGDDEDDDSDSDEGLLMFKAKRRPPKEAQAASSTRGPMNVRRRDTNTSIASTETAKKVAVHSD
ncbi:uncharacterized protein E0L32_008836 [Thyridium curvatum]|uniref:non-specific serine/threonine protein kinase n=1 Tax=Thyridium curvatum TaxID=1093900 RepID=A0A507AY88_9PEZI|nr:uncharacterized protein E0L32_008836 [Thyridium curvatum]TPX09989.1 hypothetical protein E0L32_008836 [Thyridium curvatum]